MTGPLGEADGWPTTASAYKLGGVIGQVSRECWLQDVRSMPLQFLNRPGGRWLNKADCAGLRLEGRRTRSRPVVYKMRGPACWER